VIQHESPLVDVPAKHDFDREALRRYMVEHVEGCENLRGFSDVKKFSSGQSNPTFLLTTQGTVNVRIGGLN